MKYLPLIAVTLTIGASACKLTNKNSDLNIVGGNSLAWDDPTWEGVRPLATGCTGTLVTLDNYRTKNYILTLTACANELVPPGKQTSIQREAVAREVDSGSDDNWKLGIIDIANLSEISKERRPFTVNNKKPPTVGTNIAIVGYGCSDIKKPFTDFDVKEDRSTQKRMASNVVKSVDPSKGVFTFRSPISGGPGKGAGCPRGEMPTGQTADDGSPVFWGSDASGKPMIGGVVLFSKVIGNEIETTAKYLANERTSAFLEKFLHQDAPNVEAADESTYDMMQNAHSKGGVGAGGKDWMPGNNGKMTCHNGQHATGLYAHSGYGTLRCKAKPYNSGDWIKQEVVTVYDSGDKGTGRMEGKPDWMRGERKFECPRNMFVGGVLIEKGHSRLSAMLCVESRKSSQYSFNECRTVPTYEKEANCANDEYIGGISVKFHGSPANHVGALLCCKY